LVDELASRFADPFGLTKVCRAAGLLRDIGKASGAFQSYLQTQGSTRGYDHSTAGARVAFGHYRPDLVRSSRL